MSIPPIRRVCFVALETLVIVYPGFVIVSIATQFNPHTSQIIFGTFLPVFLFSLAGLCVWMIRYTVQEPKLVRVGLSTLLGIVVLLLLSLPTMKT